MLHSGDGGPAFIYADPVARFHASATPGETQADPRVFLREARERGRFVAGLIAYEWGAGLNQTARAEGGTWPDLALGAYPARLRIDPAGALHAEGEADAAARLAAQARTGRLPTMNEAVTATLEPQQPRDQVEAAIAHVIARIRAGDFYQANLSQLFSADLSPGDEPYAAWARLVRASPAPYAGFFRLSAERVAATNSPELFLALTPQGEVRSRPIKGTRPRSADADVDAAHRAALLASEKDRAENLMIVDLMRNDLSRVCAPGSVAAPTLFAVESYANVHHLASTVRGRLRGECELGDLLMACFPPGSITGAPKRQAMKEIAALEGVARGPYCGAMGHVDPQGAATFNVMIRTVDFARRDGAWRAEARSGGGVVAGSSPAAEYEETLAKLASIRLALTGGGA